MPIYEFLTEDGNIVEKLFPIDNIPESVLTEDGKNAKRIISSCNFNEKVDDRKQQDEEKVREERRRYMREYNVDKFIPLRGQSEEQAFEDFKKTKNQQQEEILRKNEKRQKINAEKWNKKRKCFKEMEKQYLEKKEKEKKIEYEKNKISI